MGGKNAFAFEIGNKKTTRRRIFAILALKQKVGQILDFIRECLYDNDPPFILALASQKGLRRLERKVEGGALISIGLFTKWQIFEIEYFDIFQWQLMAPC
jgi:hypothetical protein